MNTNARGSRMRPSSSRRGGDRRGRVAFLDDELDLRRVVATPGSVSAAPRSSRTRSATNGRLRAAGLSAAQARIALLTSGRSAVSEDDEHERGQHEREEQELDDAAEAAAAATTAPSAVAAVAVAARRLVASGT